MSRSILPLGTAGVPQELLDDETAARISADGVLTSAAADAQATADAAVPTADLASVANGLGLSLAGVEDAGGYYSGTTGEAVLAEIGAAARRVHARVYWGTAQTAIAHSDWRRLVPTTEAVDADGIHASGVFTAPSWASRCRVAGQVELSVIAAAKYGVARILNATAGTARFVGRSGYGAADNGYIYLPLSCEIPVTAGDAVECQVYHTNTAADLVVRDAASASGDAAYLVSHLLVEFLP